MEPLFIAGPAGKLFSVYYPPVNAPIKHAVLHIPGFAEEMNKSRRMTALQAKAMANNGYAVLVLDLFGTGDSYGDFGDATWPIWLDDIHTAINWLKGQGAETIHFWALRVGALLAMDFISRGLHPVHSLLCWQPVLNGQVFVTQFLRLRVAAAMMDSNAPQEKTADLIKQLQAGQAIEVAGYLLHPELIKPMLELRSDALDLSSLKSLSLFEIVANLENGISAVNAKFMEHLKTIHQQADLSTVVGSPFWATQEIAEVPALIDETVKSLLAAGKLS